MNFTSFDFKILVGSTLMILLLSIILSGMGLANEDVNSTDIPELDPDSGRFDIAGDIPRSPGTPSQGELVYKEALGGDSDNQIWLTGSSTAGAGGDNHGQEIVLSNPASTNDSEVNITLNYWQDNSLVRQSHTTLSLGEVHSDDLGSGNVFEDIDIRFQYVNQFGEPGDDSFEAYVQYKIHEEQSESGWFRRIPVIGHVLSTGEQVAAVVAWVGSIIWWGIMIIFELLLNIIGSIFVYVEFAFKLISFIIEIYTNLVSSTDGPIRALLAIPGLMLSIEVGKIILIGVKVLPFT